MNKYIIVRTLCDKKEMANQITNSLLEKKLIAGSQTSEVHSKYWWKNYLEECSEYKLEFRTKLSRYKEIEEEIKRIHDYNLPEISYNEIKGSKEFEEWIDKFVED